MLCRLPKIRLGEALEFLEEVLDSTLTAQPHCDQDLLGMAVWLLTKIKPNLMISDLRCTRYIELYDRLRKASNRIKHCNALDFNDVLQKLVQSQLDPADVVDLAMNRGFDHQWLDKKKKDTKKQGGTKRHIMEMFQAPSPQAPLALTMGAAPASQALEPAPSTGPVQAQAAALQQEVNKLKEQLLQNELSNLKIQLAHATRATKRQRLGQDETPPGGPAREAVEPVQAEVPAEGERQGVAPASELASAPEAEGAVDPGPPAGVEGEGKAPEGPAPARLEGEGKEPEPEEAADQGAQAEVEEPQAPELEAVQCVLCHEYFKLTDAGLTKMPHCTHTWHAECIEKYMEVTGKPLETACPMRCTPTEDQVPADVFDLGDEDPVA